MPPSTSPLPPIPRNPPSAADLKTEVISRPYIQAGSPVNVAFIALSVLVTFYVSFGADTERMMPFLISLTPRSEPGMFSEIFGGQIWRLWTPMFLHYSVAHLGFNMVGMYNLGAPLERVNGSRTYLVLCLVLALLSNLGQYLIDGSPYFGGMSGVLYGLFGYIWLRGRSDPEFVLQLPTETTIVAMVWFVVCFTGWLGPIGNSSHSTGLIVGAVWGVAAGRTAVRQRRLSRGQMMRAAETSDMRPDAR